MTTNRPIHGTLTETELDRLGKFLDACNSNGMNLEQFDGFFAALIVGPDVVLPSEYWPEVFGGKMSEFRGFETPDHAQDVLGLMMRHWNGIAQTLNKGEVRFPILFEDENGASPGNDWARGFMRGVNMRREAWAEVINDEDHCAWILPVLILYHEHDEDPDLRPGPIRPEQREGLLLRMVVGVAKAYRHFRSHRSELKPAVPSAGSLPHRHSVGSRRKVGKPLKVGRNDPCPCGSGKKHKHCCGSTPVN